MQSIDMEEWGRVLDRVKTWPPSERIALAKWILSSLEPAPALVGKGHTVRELFGPGDGSGTAPDDETIKRWRDEHLMEKYG